MKYGPFLIASVLLGTACADHITDLGAALLSGEQRGHPDSVKLAKACDDSASDEFMVGCVIDSAGHTFDVADGPLPVLTAPPPYGMLFRFEGGIEIDEADYSSEDPAPPVRIGVFAAPVNIHSCTPTPEGDESNRITPSVSTVKGGGIRVLVEDELPRGTQVAIILEFQNTWLEDGGFDGLPPPAPGPCDPVKGCGSDYLVGYGARFYVGEEAPIADGGECADGAK